MGVRETQSHGSISLLRIGLAALLVLIVGLAGCGSEDAASAQSCDFPSDCPVGSTCNFESRCVQVECSHCDDDPETVCMVTEDHPDGVCSRPECYNDDDCDTAAGQVCEEGLCVSDSGNVDCQRDGDCGPNETCNLQNECVPNDTGADNCSRGDCDEGQYCDQDSGECAAGDCYDSTDCGAGQICDDTNSCVQDTTDPCGGCPSGQTCNTQTSQCEPDATEPCGGCPSGETCNTNTSQCEPEQTCDPACTGGQICDTTSGNCIDNNCPAGSPEPSDCTGEYDKFNADGCFCAQCLSDNDCTGDQTCNPNGECMTCNEACDPADGTSACSNSEDYCVSNCCVECLGAADCPTDQVCVDGSCGAPPDCTADPSVCTGGTVCDTATNTCVPQQTGTSCTTDADCDMLSVCNNGQCESIMGGGGGGTCDPACPGSSTCTMGTFCTGCQTSSDCPASHACLGETCFDCSMLGPEAAMFCDIF